MAPTTRVIDQIADGLMSLRQTMRRTAAVRGLPAAAWEVDPHAGHRVGRRPVPRDGARSGVCPAPTSAAPSSSAGSPRATATVDFTPPYPTWPICSRRSTRRPSSRRACSCNRVDDHVRSCLRRRRRSRSWRRFDEPVESRGDGSVAPTTSAATDASWTGASPSYRQAAADVGRARPRGRGHRDARAAVGRADAWIAERGDAEQAFRLDPPPGEQAAAARAGCGAAWTRPPRTSGTGRFGRSPHRTPIAALTRIKKACTAAGFGTNLDQRKLFLLRNDAWPSGAEDRRRWSPTSRTAGGRTLTLSRGRPAHASRAAGPARRATIPTCRRGWSRAPTRARIARSCGTRSATRPDAAAGRRLAGAAQRVEPEPETAGGCTPAGRPRTPDSPTAVPPRASTTARRSRCRVDLEALRKHTAIFAGSGSGKTVLIRRLVEECALQGVSAIVLDPNNDLARLGDAWPEPPRGLADRRRGARRGLPGATPTSWCGRRGAESGRPLTLPAAAGLRRASSTIADEFDAAVDRAVAALAPRANVAGKHRQGRMQSRAVLNEALQYYARRGGDRPPCGGFIEMLADLPDGVSELDERREDRRRAGADPERGDGQRPAVRRRRHAGRSRACC